MTAEILSHSPGYWALQSPLHRLYSITVNELKHLLPESHLVIFQVSPFPTPPGPAQELLGSGHPGSHCRAAQALEREIAVPTTASARLQGVKHPLTPRGAVKLNIFII